MIFIIKEIIFIIDYLGEFHHGQQMEVQSAIRKAGYKIVVDFHLTKARNIACQTGRFHISKVKIHQLNICFVN